MPSFTGYLGASSDIAGSTGNPALGGKDTTGFPDLWDGNFSLRGTYSDTQPVDEYPVAQTGVRTGSFGWMDWFNRVHIQYSILDMGNLLSTQVVEFEIFSTFFEPRTLTSTDETGTEGLTLGLPIPTPIPFSEWQSRDFTLTIDVDGPPTIEANYVFHFDNRDYSLDVLGRRVVSWFVPPNWQTPIVERLEFSTNIIRAYDGSEQRFALRGDACRWFWDFAFNASDRTQRILENVIYAWGPRVWALPLWPQGVSLTVDVAPGDVTINCPTDNLDFHVDGLAVLTTLATPEIYEAIEIASLTSTTITAKRALTGTWGSGPTLVYPVRTARMTGTPAMSRFTGGHVYGRVGFRCEEPLRRTPASETLYRSYPVQTSKPDWAADPGVDYQRKIVEIDLGFSAPMVEDESGLSEPITAYRWFFTTRAGTEAFRRWLFARRGRQKAIWLPSFSDDLKVVTTVGPSAVNLDVEVAGLKNYAAAGVHRRDVRIEMKNGTVYYRRTSAYVEVDGTTERLTIDSPLGVLYQPSDFAQISWMALSRLDSDSVEIAHYTGEAAASSTIFRAPRNSA
jgi:hypothetical protein